MNTLYPAIFEAQTPSGFVVQFVDIPGAMTQGETIEECLFNGAEALSGVLEEQLIMGSVIPKPSTRIKGAHYITPDARIQAAILIKWARGNGSIAEIARALETSWPSAQRLENPKNSPNLERLEKVASVLGKKLVITFE